jgi:hypothetical protein
MFGQTLLMFIDIDNRGIFWGFIGPTKIIMKARWTSVEINGLIANHID